MLEEVSPRQLIKLANEGSCIEVDLIRAFLKLVQLLEDYDRDINVVVLKLIDALIVVQDDVGVQDKVLTVRNTCSLALSTGAGHRLGLTLVGSFLSLCSGRGGLLLSCWHIGLFF